MRIIAGSLGGRLFDSPGTHKTHPMSDKLRGALFNILGDISGLNALDPFGGSGALSFEAISRGAAHVTVLDDDKTAQKTIASNIAALQLPSSIHLVRAHAGAWLRTNPDTTFDLVLCDPPYDNLQPKLLEALGLRVAGEGTLVLSYPADMPAPELPNLVNIEQRSYGDAQLVFYKPKQ